MRRLLRWTFHALAAASLLLCLATATLWVRSYRVCDLLIAQRQEASEDGRKYGIQLQHYRCVVASFHGHLAGTQQWNERPEGHPTPPWELDLAHSAESFLEDWPNYGFVAHRGVSNGYAYNTVSWAVPHWLIVSAFAVLPSIVVFRQVRAVRRRRRRRARLGCCPACGYDLRATPGRCPECGRQGDKAKG